MLTRYFLSICPWLLKFLKNTSFNRKSCETSYFTKWNYTTTLTIARPQSAFFLIFSVQQKWSSKSDNITFLYEVSRFLANEKPSIFGKFLNILIDFWKILNKMYFFITFKDFKCWKTDNSLAQTSQAMNWRRHTHFNF